MNHKTEIHHSDSDTMVSRQRFGRRHRLVRTFSLSVIIYLWFWNHILMPCDTVVTLFGTFHDFYPNLFLSKCMTRAKYASNPTNARESYPVLENAESVRYCDFLTDQASINRTPDFQGRVRNQPRQQWPQSQPIQVATQWSTM